MDMTEQALSDLDFISRLHEGDNEGLHSECDYVMRRFVPDEVLEAIARIQDACGGFWYA